MNRSVIKNSIIYAAGNASIGVIGFILLPLYSKYLSPAEYGVFSLLQISINFLVIIVDSGLRSAFSIRYYKISNAENIKNQTVIIVWYIFLYLAITILLVLFKPLIEKFLDAELHLIQILLIALCILLIANVTFYTNYLRLTEHPFHFIIVTTLRSLIFGILNYIFVVILHLGFISLVYSTVLSTLFVSVSSIVYFSLKRRFNFTNTLSKKRIFNLLKLGIPIAFNSIVLFIISMGDKYMINALMQTDDVGLYSMGYKIGMVLDSFVIIPIGYVLTPIVYKSFSKSFNDYQMQVNKNISLILFILLPVTVMFLVMSNYVYMFLIDPFYQSSSNIVFLIVSMVILKSLTDILNMNIVVNERTRIIPFLSLGAGILNLVFNFFAIKKFGYIGAAYASLLTYFLLIIITYFISQKVMKLQYKFSKYFISLFTFFICVILTFKLKNNETFNLNILFKQAAVFFIFAAFIIFIYRKDFKHEN